MAITVDTNFEVSNPKTVAIANMAELSGARTVKTIDDLYSLPEILADSVGQEWYVEDMDAVYRLTDFEKRNSAEGWIDADYTPVSKLKVNGSPVVNYNIEVNSLNSNFDGTTPVITGINNDKELSLKNEDGTTAFYAHNLVTVTDGEDYLVTSTSSGWYNNRNPGGAIKIAGDGSSYRKVFDLTSRGAYAEPGIYLIGTFTQNDFKRGVYEYTTPGQEGIWYSTTGEAGSWTRSSSWDTLYEQIAWRNDSQAVEMKRRRSGNIFSIAKGDIYVAANAWGGGLFWSEDGKNWNVSQIYASVEDKSGDGQCNGAFNAVCYGNGIYVAGNGQSSNNSTFKDRFGLHWSTDGKKWYQSHINYPGARINSIAYGNGTFVAVGNGYTNTDKNGQPTENSVVTTGSYTSTDGKNWVFNAVYESDSRDDQGFLNVTYSENAESFIVPEFGGDKDNPYGGIWRSFDGKAWFRISDIKDNWGSACSIKSKNTAIVINDDATVFITNNVKKTFVTREDTQTISGINTFERGIIMHDVNADRGITFKTDIEQLTPNSEITIYGNGTEVNAYDQSPRYIEYENSLNIKGLDYVWIKAGTSSNTNPETKETKAYELGLTNGIYLSCANELEDYNPTTDSGIPNGYVKVETKNFKVFNLDSTYNKPITLTTGAGATNIHHVPKYEQVLKRTLGTGMKVVATKNLLYSIEEAELSMMWNHDHTSTGTDAVGQEWYVYDEAKYYRLISWENRKSEAGWVLSDSIALWEDGKVSNYINVIKNYNTIDYITGEDGTLGNAGTLYGFITNLNTRGAFADNTPDTFRINSILLTGPDNYTGDYDNFTKTYRPHIWYTTSTINKSANDFENLEWKSVGYGTELKRFTSSSVTLEELSWDVECEPIPANASICVTFTTLAPGETPSNIRDASEIVVLRLRTRSPSTDISNVEFAYNTTTVYNYVPVVDFEVAMPPYEAVGLYDNNISDYPGALQTKAQIDSAISESIKTINDSIDDIDEALEGKQDNIIAGKGILKSENTISLNYPTEYSGFKFINAGNTVHVNVANRDDATKPSVNETTKVIFDFPGQLAVYNATTERRGVVKLTADITDLDADSLATVPTHEQVRSIVDEIVETELNSLLSGDKPLVSPTLTGTWAVVQTDETYTDANISVEDGFYVAWNGTFKWETKEGFKDPTAFELSGSFMAVPDTLPASGVDSAGITTTLVQNTNSTYKVKLQSPMQGLIIKNNRVVRPTSEDIDETEASISVTFKRRYYWGYSELAEITEKALKELANTNLTTTRAITLNNVQTGTEPLYVYYCYPKKLGEVTSIILDGATSITEAFEKSEITITNDAGIEVPMYVYRSTQSAIYPKSSTIKFN